MIRKEKIAGVYLLDDTFSQGHYKIKVIYGNEINDNGITLGVLSRNFSEMYNFVFKTINSKEYCGNYMLNKKYIKKILLELEDIEKLKTYNIKLSDNKYFFYNGKKAKLDAFRLKNFLQQYLLLNNKKIIKNVHWEKEEIIYNKIIDINDTELILKQD